MENKYVKPALFIGAFVVLAILLYFGVNEDVAANLNP